MTIHVGNSHHHHHMPNPLDIAQMAIFDDTLDECDEEEKRRRRVIYLKDAIQKTRNAAVIFKVMGCVMAPFFIIPIFWPFLYLMYVLYKKQKQAMRQQLQNALEYWDIPAAEVDPEMTFTGMNG